jgi:hypothetical protein
MNLWIAVPLFVVVAALILRWKKLREEELLVFTALENAVKNEYDVFVKSAREEAYDLYDQVAGAENVGIDRLEALVEKWRLQKREDSE